MKVSIISSSHSVVDDRIYYHIALTLLENGFSPQIISSNKSTISSINEGIDTFNFDGNSITKSKKITTFITKLHEFKPSIIICSQPITVYAAHKYSKGKNIKISSRIPHTAWQLPLPISTTKRSVRL